MLRAYESGYAFGDVTRLQAHNFRAHTFGKADIVRQGLLIFVAGIGGNIDINDIEFRIDGLRHARPAGDQILRHGIRADADRDALAHDQRFTVFGLKVLQAVVHRLGHLSQGQFAQGNQVRRAEKIGQGALGPFHRVNIATLHAGLQGLRRQVGHHDFARPLDNPVRNGLAHLHTRELANRRRQAFDVLHVHSGNHIDASIQNLEDIFIALVVLAALDVGMREFIDERDLRVARQNRVNVHLFEGGAFVFQLLARHRFQPGSQLGRDLAAVSFHHPDDHILPAAAPPEAFAQHLVGFADARSIAEEELKNGLALGRRHFLQPLVWGLVHLRHSYLIARQKSNPATIVRVKMGNLRSVLRYLAVVVLATALVLFFRRLIHVNPTTVALTLLLSVLVVSTLWGLRYALLLAVLATLVFNFYFLPPVGTFTIADPQNWVAMFAFLATALVASELSERARREASNANQRRRDVERLFAFSQRLLATDNMLELLNAIPTYMNEVLGAKASAIYLAGSQTTYRSDSKSEEPNTEDLKAVSARGEVVLDRGHGLSIAPLRLGVRLTGAIGILGPNLSRETLEALGGLAAIAIERAGVIEKLGKAEAARQSENLRAALLDSVTHELRTPLTGIKAAVTSLMSDLQLDDGQRKELLTVINEESDRLNHLVGEAAEMAQLDAHVELNLQPASITQVIQVAVEQSAAVLGKHPVEVRAPDSPLPTVRMDVERIAEVLRQMLDNAAKYSAPEAAIVVTTEVRGQQVIVSVADHGPGIDEFEQPLVFEKFYRGRDLRYRVQGTGMGLAIAKAIVEAHGGAIGVTSQLGHGSVFSVSLPVS